MSFSSDVNAFAKKVEQRRSAILVGVAAEAHRSIIVGSELTGAPGQPVDTGALRNSWRLRLLGPHRATITTNLEYAPDIEDGVGIHGPLTLRSAVGGFHSVKMTILAFKRIVETVAQRFRV